VEFRIENLERIFWDSVGGEEYFEGSFCVFDGLGFGAIVFSVEGEVVDGPESSGVIFGGCCYSFIASYITIKLYTGDYRATSASVTSSGASPSW